MVAHASCVSITAKSLTQEVVFGPALVSRTLTVRELKDACQCAVLIDTETMTPLKDEDTLEDLADPASFYVKKMPEQDTVVGDVCEEPDSTPPCRLEPWEIRLKENLAEGDTFTSESDQQYSISERIGAGAQANVYRCCYSNQHNKHFAVKVFAKSKVLSCERALQDLRREIAILRCLTHPRIINLVDLAESDYHHLIVMDLAKCGTMLRVCEKSQLNETEARFVFWQVLDALCYIHSRNIIHRDIKLENILVGEVMVSQSGDGKLYFIKVADFGFAKQVSLLAGNHMPSMPQLERAVSQVGTLSYMAPEIVNWQDGTEYNQSVDYWSLGVCLYEMVMQMPPFGYGPIEFSQTDEAKSKRRRVENLEAEDPERWQELSEDLKDLISNLLEVEVAARFGSEKCLSHRWVLSGGPSIAWGGS
jgi:serine/threonine protein kinase